MRPFNPQGFIRRGLADWNDAARGSSEPDHFGAGVVFAVRHKSRLRAIPSPPTRPSGHSRAKRRGVQAADGFRMGSCPASRSSVSPSAVCWDERGRMFAPNCTIQSRGQLDSRTQQDWKARYAGAAWQAGEKFKRAAQAARSAW